MSVSISAIKQKMLYGLERDEDGYPRYLLKGFWYTQQGAEQ